VGNVLQYFVANLFSNYVPTYTIIGPVCRTYDKNILLTFFLDTVYFCGWYASKSETNFTSMAKWCIIEIYWIFYISDMKKSAAQRTVQS